MEDESNRFNVALLNFLHSHATWQDNQAAIFEIPNLCLRLELIMPEMPGLAHLLLYFIMKDALYCFLHGVFLLDYILIFYFLE
jgi:hypothetical protein